MLHDPQNIDLSLARLSDLLPESIDAEYRSLHEGHLARLEQILNRAVQVWRRQFRKRITENICVSIGGGEDTEHSNLPEIEVKETLLTEIECEIDQFGRRVYQLLENAILRDDFLPPMP